MAPKPTYEEPENLKELEEQMPVEKALGTPVGKKYDTGKAPVGLLPASAVTATANVLAFGAKKYGRHQWRGGKDWTRDTDAALRHIFAWVDGQTKDPESGENHLAHAICCLMFALSSQIEGFGTDDRYKGVG